MPGSPSQMSFTPGPGSASPSATRGGSRMRESRTYGSVRGALSNERPYRDRGHGLSTGPNYRAPCPRGCRHRKSRKNTWARRTIGLPYGKTVPAPLPTLQPSSILRFPSLRQRAAVELATLGLGQRGADHDLLRWLESWQHRAAIAQELGDIDGHARSRHHIAHDLLAIDRVRHADGRHFDQLRALHQDAVDLERRDVHAAADDQVLLAAGEAQEAIGIEHAEVAGAIPVVAVDVNAAVIAEIAVVVVGKGAD